MIPLRHHLLLAALPFAVLGAQKRATPDSFQLYAYGDGFGGLPVFYAGGYAYVGDPTFSNSTDAATVIFSSSSDNVWTGSPNTTGMANSTHTPDWSNVTLYVPTTGSSDARVGFLNSGNSSDSTKQTSGFVFYGSTAMVKVDNSLETRWGALEVGTTGVYALYWNDTSKVPLTLRSVAPSNPSSRSR